MNCTLIYLLRVARSGANPKVLLYKCVVNGMGVVIERLSEVFTRMMKNSQFKDDQDGCIKIYLVIASE